MIHPLSNPISRLNTFLQSHPFDQVETEIATIPAISKLHGEPAIAIFRYMQTHPAHVRIAKQESLALLKKLELQDPVQMRYKELTANLLLKDSVQKPTESVTPTAAKIFMPDLFGELQKAEAADALRARALPDDALPAHALPLYPHAQLDSGLNKLKGMFPQRVILSAAELLNHSLALTYLANLEKQPSLQQLLNLGTPSADLLFHYKTLTEKVSRYKSNETKLDLSRNAFENLSHRILFHQTLLGLITFWPSVIVVLTLIPVISFVSSVALTLLLTSLNFLGLLGLVSIGNRWLLKPKVELNMEIKQFEESTSEVATALQALQKVGNRDGLLLADLLTEKWLDEQPVADLPLINILQPQSELDILDLATGGDSPLLLARYKLVEALYWLGCKTL